MIGGVTSWLLPFLTAIRNRIPHDYSPLRYTNCPPVWVAFVLFILLFIIHIWRRSRLLYTRKYPDDPAREVFNAAKSGDAFLLSEVLQQIEECESAYFINECISKTNSLMVAAKNGSADCVRVLLEYNADIRAGRSNCDAANTRTLHKCSTALMIASKHGHEDVVSLLVEHEANVNLQRKRDGKSPLMYASLNGHRSVVSCLVEHGANVDLQDKKGNSPLMLACENGHVDVATFLVEHGANMDMQDQEGLTALTKASANNHMDVVTFLVKHEANVDLQDKKGNSPLMLACENGHVNVVTFLIEHGANMDMQDQEGLAALTKASANNHMDVVTFLVKHGANVDLQGRNGNTALPLAISTPLMYASINGHMNIVSFLVEHGANVNLQDKEGNTPLMLATKYHHMSVVIFLVNHGANMDLQDKNGNTALHYAVTSSKADKAGGYCVVEKLLTLGASQLYNNEQLTPLLEASNTSQWSLVQHLLKRTEYTKEQRIDALELLGASLATQATPNAATAFHYIKCGMTERFQDPSQPLFKQPMEPIEAYQFRKESQTLEELAQIEGDRNAIIMEGLVIRERILGTDNAALLEPIRCAAKFYSCRKLLFAQYIGLYIHAMKIAQHCNQSITHVLRNVLHVLDKFLRKLGQKDIALDLLEGIVYEYEQLQEKERRYGELEFKLEELCLLFDSSIKLVQTIAKFKHLEDVGKMSHLSVLLQKLCHLNPRDRYGNTLLHSAVKGKFPCIDTVKLLLNAGFNVNAISIIGNTPLHTLTALKPRTDQIHLQTDILKALFDGGAHHDFVNNAGKTAMDMAQTDEVRAILSEKRKLELKCFCARAVKKFGLPFLGVVPKALEKFISMH